jgi:serine phosphatase RsbU (regulator of sigma subunit)
VTVAGLVFVIGVEAGPGAGADVEAVADLAAEMVRGEMESRRDLDSLSQEVAETYEEMNLFYELGPALARMHDEQEICRHVLSEAVRVIGGERSCLLLSEGPGSPLRVAAHVNLDDEDQALTIPPGQGIAGLTAETGRTVHLDAGAPPPAGVARLRDGSWLDARIATPPLLSVPLRAGGGTVGVLLLTNKAFGRPFSARDLKLAQAVAFQAALLIENSRQVRRLRDGERIQREIEIARSIQQGLLPRRDPVVQGLDLAGQCRPAADVGGDYFGYMDVLPGLTGLSLMDVSGHSVAAAVCMASIRGVLRCEAWSRRSTREVVERVNDIVARDLEEGGMYATLFYALYEHRSGELRYTNAGHPPALLLRAGEERCRRLSAGGMGIGIAERQVYREEVLKLVRGDVLLIYSDGITDTRSPSGALFGEARLAQLLGRYRPGTSWEILSSVLGEIEAFAGGGPQTDDLALVVLKVTS